MFYVYLVTVIALTVMLIVVLVSPTPKVPVTGDLNLGTVPPSQEQTLDLLIHLAIILLDFWLMFVLACWNNVVEEEEQVTNYKEAPYKAPERKV